MFVGIPSVVWGWLGIVILVPFLRTQFGWAGFNVGFSWLAGSLVVAVMILPTVTAVTYDSYVAIPQDQRTASLALGTTRWQTIRHILIPSASGRNDDRHRARHDARRGRGAGGPDGHRQPAGDAHSSSPSPSRP